MIKFISTSLMKSSFRSSPDFSFSTFTAMKVSVFWKFFSIKFSVFWEVFSIKVSACRDSSFCVCGFSRGFSSSVRLLFLNIPRNFLKKDGVIFTVMFTGTMIWYNMYYFSISLQKFENKDRVTSNFRVRWSQILMKSWIWDISRWFELFHQDVWEWIQI